MDTTWSFSAKDIKLLDKNDAPMLATLAVVGDVEDDFGGGDSFAWASRKTVKTLVHNLRRHCRELICCDENKDSHYDYANDEVKPGVKRSDFLLISARVKIRSFGRSIREYNLKSLRAASVEYGGRCAMFLPSKDHSSGGVWVDRKLSIDRDGVLTMITIPPVRPPDWKCLYCGTMNCGGSPICAKDSCGGKRRTSESITDRSARLNVAEQVGNGFNVGDVETIELDPKKLCGVQMSSSCHGRSHCVLVTLNRLPNGTVINAAAHHRGRHQMPTAAQSFPAEGGTTTTQQSSSHTSSFWGSASTLRTLTFSCDDEESSRELQAAFKNSTSTVLPSVRRAAQVPSFAFVVHHRAGHE
jgi:hypothetical protein